MICSCSCDIDSDAPELIRTIYPIARKSYICCECHATIPRGTKYQRVEGKWEGHWDTFITCMICKSIREEFCECWYFGGLQEAIWECLGFNYVTNEMCSQFD